VTRRVWYAAHLAYRVEQADLASQYVAGRDLSKRTQPQPEANLGLFRAQVANVFVVRCAECQRFGLRFAGQPFALPIALKSYLMPKKESAP